MGWSSSYCVTAYVGNIHFEDPIHSGDLVEVTTPAKIVEYEVMEIRFEEI